jgi:hypothetical protein
MRTLHGDPLRARRPRRHDHDRPPEARNSLDIDHFGMLADALDRFR